VLQGLEDDLVLVLCTTSVPSIIKLLHMWVCYKYSDPVMHFFTLL
jgi:hypothetical protein